MNYTLQNLLRQRIVLHRLHFLIICLDLRVFLVFLFLRRLRLPPICLDTNNALFPPVPVDTFSGNTESLDCNSLNDSPVII